LKIYTPKDFPLNFETVVSIGSFDGIHLGHKRLLEETLKMAKSLGVTPAVLSFDPHPRLVLCPSPEFKLLTTLEEKTHLISKLGIEHLVLIPFSLELATTSPELFVEEFLLDSLRVRGVVIGFNFRFGKNKEGTPEFLKKKGEIFGFEVLTVSPVEVNGTLVSSTNIRRFLLEGDIERANLLLGHGYLIKGKVIKGAGRGRCIGFPTANLGVPDKKLIPKPGVYAVWVKVKSKLYKGAMNIGIKPTFDGKELSLEVHILNFSGNLYGEELCVEVIARIREEKKFSSPQELEKQIKKDCLTASQVLSEVTPKAL